VSAIIRSADGKRFSAPSTWPAPKDPVRPGSSQVGCWSATSSSGADLARSCASGPAPWLGASSEPARNSIWPWSALVGSLC